MTPNTSIKARNLLSKYRIEKKLGNGGFATLYQALDTLEGIRVALKFPHPYLIDQNFLEHIRHEVRLAARLDHPNILPLMNADFINRHLVLCYPLGERTLGERLQSRIAFNTAMGYAEQMLAATSHAHEQRVRIRGRRNPGAFGCPLHRYVYQSGLRAKGIDAVYAVLSLVPSQGEAKTEARRKP